ncbi:hypothetical protein VTO73DRAFT_10729 [Trametes versicolor]
MFLHSVFAEVAPGSREDDARPSTTRAGLRIDIQGSVNGSFREQSGDDTARMRYEPQCYASEVVVKRECKVVGWPEDIPFKSLSEIRGGVTPLFELRRRWNLPDGHPDKLRIERATPEDIANAIRDPDSVHPNLKLLQKERKEAADAAEAATKAAEYVVPVYTWHPDNMCFVGLDLISTEPPEPKSQRSQRIDSGLRRKRASDGSPWAREKLSMTKGITSCEKQGGKRWRTGKLSTGSTGQREHRADKKIRQRRVRAVVSRRAMEEKAGAVQEAGNADRVRSDEKGDPVRIGDSLQAAMAHCYSEENGAGCREDLVRAVPKCDSIHGRYMNHESKHDLQRGCGERLHTCRSRREVPTIDADARSAVRERAAPDKQSVCRGGALLTRLRPKTTSSTGDPQIPWASSSGSGDTSKAARQHARSCGARIWATGRVRRQSTRHLDTDPKIAPGSRHKSSRRPQGALARGHGSRGVREATRLEQAWVRSAHVQMGSKRSGTRQRRPARGPRTDSIAADSQIVRSRLEASRSLAEEAPEARERLPAGRHQHGCDARAARENQTQPIARAKRLVDKTVYGRPVFARARYSSAEAWRRPEKTPSCPQQLMRRASRRLSTAVPESEAANRASRVASRQDRAGTTHLFARGKSRLLVFPARRS